jgi:prevent-host-death family protein
MKASEFKTHCLEIMDSVAQTGDTLVITKHGKPVAQLGPVIERRRTLLGLHESVVKVMGDLIAPVDVDWDVVG